MLIFRHLKLFSSFFISHAIKCHKDLEVIEKYFPMSIFDKPAPSPRLRFIIIVVVVFQQMKNSSRRSSGINLHTIDLDQQKSLAIEMRF